MSDRYRRLVFRVDGESDQLEAELWELGTLGLELAEGGGVVAYFAGGSSPRVTDWSRYGARLEVDEACETADWMAAYREASRPVPVGERLVLDPREPQASEREAGNWPTRHLLRLPARTAFGTGSHASTRLVLELMEGLEVAGKRVLDVGVGSGVLSFAALVLGASRVSGVEVDAAALLVGAQNRGLNRLHPAWIAGTVAALEAPGRFDLALVNVLPDKVAADLGRIRNLLSPAGMAVFSGIPAVRESEIAERLESAGFRLRGRRRAEEWSALVADRGQNGSG